MPTLFDMPAEKTLPVAPKAGGADVQTGPMFSLAGQARQPRRAGADDDALPMLVGGFSYLTPAARALMCASERHPVLQPALSVKKMLGTYCRDTRLLSHYVQELLMHFDRASGGFAKLALPAAVALSALVDCREHPLASRLPELSHLDALMIGSLRLLSSMQEPMGLFPSASKTVGGDAMVTALVFYFIARVPGAQVVLDLPAAADFFAHHSRRLDGDTAAQWKLTLTRTAHWTMELPTTQRHVPAKYMAA